MTTGHLKTFVGLLALSGMAGCASQGPSQLPDPRSAYGSPYGSPSGSTYLFYGSPGWSRYQGYGGVDPWYYYRGGYPAYGYYGTPRVPPTYCRDADRDGRCDRRTPGPGDDDDDDRGPGRPGHRPNVDPDRVRDVEERLIDRGRRISPEGRATVRPPAATPAPRRTPTQPPAPRAGSASPSVRPVVPPPTPRATTPTPRPRVAEPESRQVER